MNTPFFAAIISYFKRFQTIEYQLFDIIIAGYILLIGILLVPFHHHVPYWPLLSLFHLFLFILLFEFLRLSEKNKHPVLDFIRLFYPVAALLGGWVELNTIVTMIFPFWANAYIVKLDVFVFGTHPTVWVERLFTPWLTEIMNFSYTVYYLFIPVIGFVLFVQNKRQDAFDYFSSIMFTVVSCFVLYLLIPCEGAWTILKDLHTKIPTGGIFLKLNQFLQSHGSNEGCAFPSSHVSIAFTMALAALKYKRPLGYLALLNAIGVAASTVYLRYHHGVDSLSGIVMGIVCYLISEHLIDKWKDYQNRPLKLNYQKTEVIQLVDV